MQMFIDLVVTEARALSGHCKLELFARADKEPIFNIEFKKDKTGFLRELMKDLCKDYEGKELLVIFRDDRVSIFSITLDKEGNIETKNLKDNSTPTKDLPHHDYL